jgi:hypothetical protein
MAISTSKTKKIIAIIKNRREKGTREFEKGSNPHSKGEVFSRSVFDFFLKIEAVMIMIIAKADANIVMAVKDRIIFSVFRPSHWK